MNGHLIHAAPVALLFIAGIALLIWERRNGCR